MSKSYRIIYVDDEPEWNQLLKKHINRINKLELNKKFDVKLEAPVYVKSAADFVSNLTTDGPFDLALIDLQLTPGQVVGASEGETLLRQMLDIDDAPPRVVLTARPWALPVREALAYGISEYYLKNELIAEKADEGSIQECHRNNFQNFIETFFDLPSRYDFCSSDEERKRFGLRNDEPERLNATIVGDELCIWKAKARIAAAARSNLPVLITGESGTGKELAAEMIHQLSDRGRKNYDWVALNCAAFTSDLLMSELFGHVKGAFTDARSDKRGLLQQANESTLFLDEVGLAKSEFQAALLRALSTGRARPLGSTEEYPFDLRLIAATDQAVYDSEILQRSFLNRLAGIHIEMPPLRTRKSDIESLVESFKLSVSRERKLKFTPAAIMELMKYDWPGNVRELKHVVEAASSESIRMTGEAATEVNVDAAQVQWLLQQSMARFVPSDKEEGTPFVLYTTEGHDYKQVERRFLAHYVHHMHADISNGERTNSAYEKTAATLGCSVSTVKAKLTDYDELIER
jgi:DNA-binding NtrC family response regulator